MTRTINTVSNPICKHLILLFALMPIVALAQKPMDRKDYFANIPYKDGQIIYEQVILLDSVNSVDQVYNAAKAALIKNTKYKYSKIDEDRVAGSISTEIRYHVTNQAAVRLNIFAISLLTIDVKENRFRIRITNSEGEFQFMGERMITSQLQFYQNELVQIQKGKKWKAENSYSVMWDLKIKEIMDAFSILISKGVTDDF